MTGPQRRADRVTGLECYYKSSARKVKNGLEMLCPSTLGSLHVCLSFIQWLFTEISAEFFSDFKPNVTTTCWCSFQSMVSAKVLKKPPESKHSIDNAKQSSSSVVLCVLINVDNSDDKSVSGDPT